MVYEVSLRYKQSDPVEFTCADGTAITKGSVLKLTDPLTAIITSAASDPIAGIAAHDKVASDGRTRIGAYRNGIFDMWASGTINIGNPVCAASTANCVIAATGIGSTNSGATIIGHALEAGAIGEQILVQVQLM